MQQNGFVNLVLEGIGIDAISIDKFDSINLKYIILSIKRKIDYRKFK